MINNDFYNDLYEKWYSADDHPVALLRAENASRIPWMVECIRSQFGEKKCTVLDIGCGAGLTTNLLAKHGHKITGIDLSKESLAVAEKKDITRSVRYIQQDAQALSFQKASFDVVCAMDFLEHVENPEHIIAEASKVLMPGGIFFFHTFNRNLWSYLIAIKGVEWFVKNTPRHMHLHKLFIKPQEIQKFCSNSDLKVGKILGSSPKINKAFFKLILTRCVPKEFEFKFTSSLKLGYFGYAIKENK